jgi:hypothetical protein
LRPTVPDVAYYVAKFAVNGLNPATPATARSRGGASSATTSEFNLYALLKGIVKVLADLVEHSKVCPCPALRHVPLSSALGI